MKFTRPVIAAISVGSLVLLALIIVVILYLKGFSGDKPEKPVLSDELKSALEKAKPYLNNEIVFDALSTFNFVGKDVQDAFGQWQAALTALEDKAGLEILLDTFIVCSKTVLESVKKHIGKGKEKELKKAVDDSKLLFGALLYVSSMVRGTYMIDSGKLFKNPDTYLRLCSDVDTKRIALKALSQMIIYDEFHILDPNMAREKRKRKLDIAKYKAALNNHSA